MTSLMSISQEQTMTSLELMAIVNKSRIDAGETPHEPRKFLAKVEDEIDDLTGKKFRLNNNQTKTVYYDLTRDQCMLVGMRESKAVRRSVLEKLKKVEQVAKTPAVKDPQLAAMVMMLTQLDGVKQEQEAQRIELSEIKAKIQATPEQFYTVAGYASLRGLSIDTTKANLLGRKAAKLSREYDMEIGKAHSAMHGTVNTYHVDILCEAFG